jgi:phage terminase small subunit
MNARQQRFVTEYLIDCNATQAAIRAGYGARTARQVGSQNLSKLDIQSAIKEAQEKRNGTAVFTRERALEILADLALNAERDNNKIAAIAQASKMSGWESAQRHEIDVTEIVVKRITPDMIEEPPTPLEEVTEPVAQ